MDILDNAAVGLAGEVVVNNVHDVLNIESTSRNSSRDEDRAFGSTESTPVSPSVTGFSV